MLTRAIRRYLQIRRAGGFDLKVEQVLLRGFASFATARAETHVRRQTAIDWAAQAPSPFQRERRLGMVRRFVDHVRAEDPAHEIVPRGVFASKSPRRPLPFLLSPEDVSRLLEATSDLRPRGSLRPLTYHTLFGLLAATGLRISEAMHLLLADVTPDGIVVRKTKFRKSRLLPLHATTESALKRYLDRRRAVGGSDDHVFISTNGRALSYAMINGTFQFLLKRIHLCLKPGQRARIHDLRHYFAVRALESCKGGHDHATRHILALSTYLGHAYVTDTYWYLQATPRLMGDIADACQAFIRGGES
jgi:integrase/recombinase XerD